jgi:hypothetical protein
VGCTQVTACWIENRQQYARRYRRKPQTGSVRILGNLAGYYWSWLVLSGLASGALLGTERYMEIRYEELVLNAERTLQRLCSWLGLAYDGGLLEYYRTEAAQSFATEDATPSERRIVTPLDGSRVQRWKSQMTSADRREILRQTGGVLAHLGYEVDELTPSQLGVKKALDCLLHPQDPAILVKGIRPHGGNDWRIRTALCQDRARQLVALVAGQMDTFVDCSVRWQRSVSSLLVTG